MVKGEKGKAERSTFGDKYGATQFYVDLPKIPLVEVLDIQYLIKDARIVEGFKSKFGKSSFALFLIEDDEARQATTLCGGEAVVEKMEKAIADGALPLYGTITKVESKDGNEYYDIN